MGEEVHKVSNRQTKIKKPHREMTFVEHLDSLRSHLIRGVVVIVLFAIVAFFFKDFIFNDVILAPKRADFFSNVMLCKVADLTSTDALCINQNDFKIINIDLSGQFKAHLIVSLIFGLLVAFPYLIYELWRFIKPALQKREFKYSRRMVFWISILFSLGVLFGYFIIVPLAINFLSNYNISSQLENTINFTSYFSTIATTSLGTGLVFEIPIASYVLAKIGLIDDRIMKKYRRHAIVLAFVLSGIITPPDVFSQILVSFPILFLYEISISIVKKVAKNRRIVLDV